MKLRIRTPRQASSANADMMHRTSLMDIDRSGRVKMITLESVYIVQSFKDWCKVEDIYQELERAADSPFDSGRNGVYMRLLRYKRKGLLIKRKMRGKLTEYKLSEKGENRLIYFWKKFKLLEPPPRWQFMGEKGRIDKENAKKRSSMHFNILANQAERLINDRPLRTPKVRQVIRFQSTLTEIKERKKRWKAYPRF